VERLAPTAETRASLSHAIADDTAGAPDRRGGPPKSAMAYASFRSRGRAIVKHWKVLRAAGTCDAGASGPVSWCTVEAIGWLALQAPRAPGGPGPGLERSWGSP